MDFQSKNQIALEIVKSMLLKKNMLISFWAEAVNSDVYLINRSPTKELLNQSPFQAWSERKLLVII